MKTMPLPAQFPFEASFEQVQDELPKYVDAVFESLESAFLVMPRGDGFVEYDEYKVAYEALRMATQGFTVVEVDTIFQVAQEHPLTLLVLRSILGFTPPEWADVATIGTGVKLSQGYARSLDRNIRMNPVSPPATTPLQRTRLRAMIAAACDILRQGAPTVEVDQIHRLDKTDTKDGLESLRKLANEGVPYEMLLYERYLGRPYASHRDSVSEVIGGMLEDGIRHQLEMHGVPYHQSRRAERFEGFDQAPDFFAPDAESPVVVIEAKLTQDDGTARDKVTRVQHLDRIRTEREAAGYTAFEVVACIGGRGFGVRRADMEKLILATRGKVFTLATLDRLVECTRLSELRLR